MPGGRAAALARHPLPENAPEYLQQRATRDFLSSVGDPEDARRLDEKLDALGPVRDFLKLMGVTHIIGPPGQESEDMIGIPHIDRGGLDEAGIYFSGHALSVNEE